MGHSVLDSTILVVLGMINILKQITIIITHIVFIIVRLASSRRLTFWVITVPHGFNLLFIYVTKVKKLHGTT